MTGVVILASRNIMAHCFSSTLKQVAVLTDAMGLCGEGLGTRSQNKNPDGPFVSVIGEVSHTFGVNVEFRKEGEEGSLSEGERLSSFVPRRATAAHDSTSN